MKNTRVIVLTHHAEAGHVTVEEVSHGSIFGSAAMPAQHILYNGKDHYDALIELSCEIGNLDQGIIMVLPVVLRTAAVASHYDILELPSDEKDRLCSFCLAACTLF